VTLSTATTVASVATVLYCTVLYRLLLLQGAICEYKHMRNEGLKKLQAFMKMHRVIMKKKETTVWTTRSLFVGQKLVLVRGEGDLLKHLLAVPARFAYRL